MVPVFQLTLSLSSSLQLSPAGGNRGTPKRHRVPGIAIVERTVLSRGTAPGRRLHALTALPGLHWREPLVWKSLAYHGGFRTAYGLPYQAGGLIAPSDDGMLKVQQPYPSIS